MWFVNHANAYTFTYQEPDISTWPTSFSYHSHQTSQKLGFKLTTPDTENFNQVCLYGRYWNTHDVSGTITAKIYGDSFDGSDLIEQHSTEVTFPNPGPDWFCVEGFTETLLDNTLYYIQIESTGDFEFAQHDYPVTSDHESWLYDSSWALDASTRDYVLGLTESPTFTIDSPSTNSYFVEGSTQSFSGSCIENGTNNLAFYLDVPAYYSGSPKEADFTTSCVDNIWSVNDVTIENVGTNGAAVIIDSDYSKSYIDINDSSGLS